MIRKPALWDAVLFYCICSAWGHLLLGLIFAPHRVISLPFILQIAAHVVAAFMALNIGLRHEANS